MLATGTRLWPYEITGSLGAGGMGEVYRARDTRLERAVAIKVLPAHSADRPEVRQRFEREARAVSALNHPNICTLHDVGREGETGYLVMEYLEGETLAGRLQKGALGADDALRIAIQVAEGLECAHRAGITHRDLKPANVMLTRNGAKILDFGLAKIGERAAGVAVSGGSVLETLTTPLTGEGSIVGTLQYMSPEQLEGQEADARSDIFAFGAMLYEMASGRRPFEAKTQASLIAKIMESDPAPVSSVAPAAPVGLDRLLTHCMAKDPAERRQTMHDVLIDLRWIARGGSEVNATPAPTASTGAAAWRWKAAAAALGIAAVVFGILYALRPALEDPPMQLTISPPDQTTFGYGLVISPDGFRVAFAARTGDSRQDMLWVRSIDSLEARQIAGTEDAQFPFWSPDSRQLGFFAGKKLKRVDIERGMVQVLADAREGRGGSWSQDGTILFAGDTNTPLYRIAAAGGTPIAVTQIDTGAKEVSHRWPQLLPDGRHFVCFVYMGAKKSHLAAGSLDSKTLKNLVPADSAPAYGLPGQLLYVRGNVLMAQRFDAGRLEPMGDAVPLARNVASEGEAGPTGYARFSISRNGRLVYSTVAAVRSILTWMDRSGKTLETVGEAGSMGEPELSPDGTRVAYTWLDSPVGQSLWVFDMARKVGSRLVHRGAGGSTVAWSPDGSQIVFSMRTNKVADLFLQSSNGAGGEELLVHSENDKFTDGWSPDGRMLVVDTVGPAKKVEIWTLSMSDRKLSPLIQSEANNGHGALSPNGRWLAYVSDETGRPEVYVRSFPVPNEKYTISPAGGDQPMWRRDGKQLFYISLQGKLMEAPVNPGAPFSAGPPAELFDLAGQDISPHIADSPKNYYAPAANGEKFLVIASQEIRSSLPIVLVTNWSAGLGK